MTGYDSTVPAWVRSGLRMADAVLPGELPVERALSRRSRWGVLPSARREPPDGTRRLAVTLDLDYQADTDALPGLLDLLGRHGVPVSLASIGALVESDPGPYRRAVAEGHEIVNHTDTHPDNPVLNPHEEFWHLPPGRMIEEIGRAQDTCETRLGVRPTGFRTPHFKDTHAMVAALESFPEIRYVSSALSTRAPAGPTPFPMARTTLAGEAHGTLFGDTDPGNHSRVWQVPLTACPAHRWSPFCSWHGIRAGAAPGSGGGMHSLQEWEELWGRMLARAAPAGLAVVYFDPHDLMRDDRTARAFSSMLTRAASSGWRFSTLAEVAAAYRPTAPPPSTAAAR